MSPVGIPLSVFVVLEHGLTSRLSPKQVHYYPTQNARIEAVDKIRALGVWALCRGSNEMLASPWLGPLVSATVLPY